MYVKFVTAIVLIPVLLVFALQNGGIAKINFLFLSMDLPVVVAIIISAVLGFFIAMGVFALKELELKKTIYKRNMEVKKLKKEIASLNNSTFVRDIKVAKENLSDDQLQIQAQIQEHDYLEPSPKLENSDMALDDDIVSKPIRRPRTNKTNKDDNRQSKAKVQDSRAKIDESSRGKDKVDLGKMNSILNFDDKEFRLDFKKPSDFKDVSEIPWYMGNHVAEYKKNAQLSKYEINIKKEFEDFMKKNSEKNLSENVSTSNDQPAKVQNYQENLDSRADKQSVETTKNIKEESSDVDIFPDEEAISNQSEQNSTIDERIRDSLSSGEQEIVETPEKDDLILQEEDLSSQEEDKKDQRSEAVDEADEKKLSEQEEITYDKSKRIEELVYEEDKKFNFINPKQNTASENTLSKESVAKRFNWKSPVDDFMDRDMKVIQEPTEDDIKSKIINAIKPKRKN